MYVWTQVRQTEGLYSVLEKGCIFLSLLCLSGQCRGARPQGGWHEGLHRFPLGHVHRAWDCSALDLGALPGVEGTVCVDAVVEMRAKLVEDRASVAESVGGHRAGPFAPSPMATEGGEWGVGVEVH